MGRGIGNVLGAVAPIAAGYFGGPLLAGSFGGATGGAIAAGALAGGGIAALSGQDILTGAAMGGLSGYGGGQMQAAFNPTQALMQPGVDLTAAELNAATNASLTNGATAAGVQLPADAVNPLTQGTDLFASGSNIPGQGAGINNMASFSTPQTPNIMAGQMPAGVGGIPGTNLTDPSTIPQLDTSFSAGVKRLGGDSTAMGYGKLGLSGLGALSSMPVETQSFESVKDKYDPNSRLNLSMDTGIDEALRKDSGLRLYNQGGLMALAGGGYLETGGTVGDGMSDEIKATIDGEQEARLSDGEFVLPADIVSHLGNGSSDAGAKQLYSMMDRLRQARTGTEKQGTEIDVGRYMPA
jgi:hypothetical protein